MLRTSKTSDLFQTIFLVLSFLLICMLSYMTFFMDRFVFQGQAKELDHSNITMLEQANESILQTVSDLEQQVRMFLSDPNIMQYLLSDKFAGAEARMRILQTMKSYANLTPSISKLWLYAPLTKTVLSSDGYLTSRYGSRADLILSQYEDQNVPRSAPDLRLATVTLDNTIYLLVDFVPAQQLGCFIFQLDARRLGISPSQDQPPILVVDSDGRLLLAGNQAAEENLQFNLEQTELFYRDLSDRHTSQQHYYEVVNDKLGWHLLMEINNGPDLYDHSVFWAMVLPFLVVLMLLGAAGAYFITRKIYTPINRLLSLAMDRTGSIVPPGETFDYLESAYQQTLQTNEPLRSRLSLLGRDVCQYLCRKAIDGRLSDVPDSDRILNYIPDGRFHAALLRLSKNRVELQQPMKFKLQSSVLEHLAAQIPECLCCLDIEPDTVMLVLLLPGEEEQPGLALQLLEAFLAQAAEQTGSQLLYGLGSGCNSLSDLKDSYEQAMHDLRYHSYLQNDPDPATAWSLQNKLLEEQLNRAINQAIQSKEELGSQAFLIAQMAEQDAQDDEDRLQRYCFAQSLLLEKLMLWDAPIQSLQPLDPNAPGANNREEFLAFCAQALEIGRTIAGKKKFRYVEEGKKFIRENYMNCSLSANDISDHVGISSSYFSSLFNELLHESMTSYLNRIRVEQAKRLLTVTIIPIKEIGFRCGFNSANVFGRVFKKYTGQSPTQFRDVSSKPQEGGSHGS